MDRRPSKARCHPQTKPQNFSATARCSQYHSQPLPPYSSAANPQAAPHTPYTATAANPYLAEKRPHLSRRTGSWLFAQRKRLRPMLAVAAALLLVIVALNCATTALRTAQGAWVSDPPSQWRQGTVPHLYQTDPAWSQEPYAGSTIGTSGCGPTCLSAVYVALTGNTNFTPVEAAALATRDGHIIDGLTAWTLMDAGAASLGLTSRAIPANPSAVQIELAAGHPLIASMGPGDFTSSGHYIVLTSLDDAGQLHVMDPNSEPRSQKSWNLDSTLAQVRGLWSFSAGA